MVNNSEKQQIEWEQLYKKIVTVLSPYGKNDFLCREGFWVVDDNWGSNQHKIYLNDETVIKDEIFNEIQKCLKIYENNWDVICIITNKNINTHTTTITINRNEIIKTNN